MISIDWIEMGKDLSTILNYRLNIHEHVWKLGSELLIFPLQLIFELDLMHSEGNNFPHFPIDNGVNLIFTIEN